MARNWCGWLSVLCLTAYISCVQSAVNLECSQLEKVFTTCPCVAAPEEEGSKYGVIDCSNKGLQAVPIIKDSFDKTIYRLILKDNRITQLTGNSFQGLKVQNLDLSGNILSSVDNGTFLSMKDTLRTLKIDGDSNNQPPIDALKSLSILESLIMKNYNVPYIEESNKFFLSFTSLKSLTLDNWKTKHIAGSSFLGLDRLKSLAILNQKLENLPIDALYEDPFNNLETLQFSHTKIKSVSPQAFKKLSKLKNLDLSFNKLNEIEKGSFTGVEDTLENLNLRGNLLNEEDGKLTGLAGLTALLKLDLSQNIFQKIPSIPALDPTNPLELLLNDNEISGVQDGAFYGYAEYLNHLDLRNNFIRVMSDNSFNGVTKLTSFILNIQKGIDSTPVKLPISLTQSASTLESIDLSGQAINPSTLWPIISKLTALKYINLKSTELKSVPDFKFQDLNVLQRLDLSYNSLSDLTQKSLVGLRQLNWLDLEENNIQTIPNCIFHEFEASKITLMLGHNPIKCDCKINKLLTDVASQRIEFPSGEEEPKCNGDSQPLTSKQPNMVCNPPVTPAPCGEYYTTISPSGPVTKSPNPELQLTILEVTVNTIKASWTIRDETNLKKYRIEATTSKGDAIFSKDISLSENTNKIEVTSLPANTYITVCVRAFLQNGVNIIDCRVNKTKTEDGPDKEGLEGDSGSVATGIIVGCVVAGVAVIGIVIAIVILLVMRKKPKDKADDRLPPPQPRSFAKAELPSMTGDTRSFSKPKKNGKGPHSDSMQIVAISDGQTSQGARVGRANKMFQPEDGYEPMNNFRKEKSHSGSLYENDHGTLPPTPGQDSIPPAYPGGYYNQGFSDDKYDQIEVEL